MYINMHIYIHVYTYIPICIFLFICILLFIYIYIYIHIHVYTYVWATAASADLTFVARRSSLMGWQGGWVARGGRYDDGRGGFGESGGEGGGGASGRGGIKILEILAIPLCLLLTLLYYTILYSTGTNPWFRLQIDPVKGPGRAGSSLVTRRSGSHPAYYLLYYTLL